MSSHNEPSELNCHTCMQDARVQYAHTYPSWIYCAPKSYTQPLKDPTREDLGPSIPNTSFLYTYTNPPPAKRQTPEARPLGDVQRQGVRGVLLDPPTLDPGGATCMIWGHSISRMGMCGYTELPRPACTCDSSVHLVRCVRIIQAIGTSSQTPAPLSPNKG